MDGDLLENFFQMPELTTNNCRVNTYNSRLGLFSESDIFFSEL